MPTDEITLPSRAATAAQISQVTAVEQARAVAEVAAQVRVAKDFPREVETASAQMRQACGQMAMAKKAFYSMPRAGGRVEGSTVHLARELARCWGNMQHGIAELSRDDRKGESEVQAHAWDVENNTRSARSFIVPHARMAGGHRKALTDLTEIVNNNNNAGARAVRETIFNQLPTWFRDEAENLCRATLERGDGVPLAERIAQMTAAFGRGGITREQLEVRVDRPAEKWDAQDVATLAVVFESLRNGDSTKADEFPPTERRVTAEELAGGTPPSGGGEGQDEAAPSGVPPSPPSQHDTGSITPEQLKKLHTMLGKVGLDDRDEALAYYARATGTVVTSSKDLSRWEANQVIEDLERAARGEHNVLDPATGYDPTDEPDWGDQS